MKFRPQIAKKYDRIYPPSANAAFCRFAVFRSTVFDVARCQTDFKSAMVTKFASYVQFTRMH